MKRPLDTPNHQQKTSQSSPSSSSSPHPSSSSLQSSSAGAGYDSVKNPPPPPTDGDDRGVQKRRKEMHSNSIHSSSLTSSSSSFSSSSSLPVASSSSSPPVSFHHEKAESIIIVSHRQQGNNLLRYLTGVPHMYGAIAPDFLVGVSACVLFLSLRYHQLFPRYLLKRIEGLKDARYVRKVLLLHVDLDIPDVPLGQVTLLAFYHGYSLLLGSSLQECAGILQLLKILENKPPDTLLAKLDSKHSNRVIEALTCISPLNKTDVLTLAGEFKTMKNILLASKEALERCTGIGEKKAKKITRVVREPFFFFSSSSSLAIQPITSSSSSSSLAIQPISSSSSSSSQSSLHKKNSSSLPLAIMDKIF